MNPKILSKREFTSLHKLLKKKNKKIVFTNGTFDILHVGHVTYLQKARIEGDVLVVGVNSDASVRAYKGPGRPINPEQERLFVLAALECVDYVVLFEDPTPIRLIQILRPDVLVKGADWKKKDIVGAAEVESWGGRVRRIKYVQDRSTTRVIKLLKRTQ